MQDKFRVATGSSLCTAGKDQPAVPAVRQLQYHTFTSAMPCPAQGLASCISYIERVGVSVLTLRG